MKKLIILILLTISINANAFDLCELICGECPVCKPTECPQCPTCPDVPEPTPEPTSTPITPPLEPDYFIPDNCKNPPKHITANDGFKCMASTTRGGTVVCLLPYQFTWKPYKDFTDHHGVTMKCNLTDQHFDKVQLILKDGSKVNLKWDKCQNWVGTNEGKIGRQHWRHPSIKWDDIKFKVKSIKMKKGNKKTCLKF